MDDILSNLINEYNTENGIENNSAIKKCIIVYQIKSALLTKYDNNPNNKGYKKEKRNAFLATNITNRMFNYDANIGEYVINQNDDTLYTKSKRQILDIISPPKPKQPKEKKPKPSVNTDNQLNEVLTEYRILQNWLDKVYAERGGFDTICEKLEINRH